jgi:hypothetical protein
MFEKEHTFCCAYTMFAHAQLLRNWLEQRPSKEGDLDWSITGKFEKSITWGWTCVLFHFHMIVGLRFKWHTCIFEELRKRKDLAFEKGTCANYRK